MGQDLVKLELGNASQGNEKQQASQEPKAPAPDKQATSSDPNPEKSQHGEKPQAEKKQPSPKPLPESPKDKSAPGSPKKPPQKQETQPSPPPTPKDSETKSTKPTMDEGLTPYGSREERRVSLAPCRNMTYPDVPQQVKMNRMRLRIAERLKQSQNTAASLTTFNEVDMSSIMQFRKLYKDEVLKKTGVKLGFMSAFSRACVLAMKEIPAVNASIEGPNGGDTIVYRDYVDISVAVATEKGLVTPVVRNAETMDLVGIEKNIAELGKKVYLQH